jgi:hypothetical protein
MSLVLAPLPDFIPPKRDVYPVTHDIPRGCAVLSLKYTDINKAVQYSLSYIY